MAVRIRFDNTHNVITPTFVLAKRNGKKLGKLPIYNLVFKDGMNTFSELSFRVNKADCVPDKDKVETTHINPINISNTISTLTGFTRIGVLSEAKYTELLNYFKVNNKLSNVKLRFVQGGTPKIYVSPSFSWDEDYTNLYLSEETGTTKLLKVDRDGNVYINNASSIGLVQDTSCLIDFSFDVPVSLIKNEFWEQITDFKLIWAREWDMWFEMYVSLDESDETVKNVSAKALGEAELSQINLYDIEINTETDIEREDYEPTVIFNEVNHKASLLHRITEKCPHYRFVHIDSSIATIQRTFTFDGTTVYDAFQDIAQEVDCLFVINCHTDTDGSILRDISVFDLESYCVECGERGNFLKNCSKCGSDNILPGYGEDTTIFVSTDNLADNIRYSTDNGSVKNCFKLSAGDDLMTATITNCNPNGSGYIWYVSEETKTDMSRELVNKLNDYDELYDYYQNEYVADVSSEIVEAYNELVEKYSIFTNDHEQIALPIIGYPAIMKAYYDTVDFYYYLKDSLMPDIEMSSTSAALEAAKLNYANLSPTAVQNLTDSTSSATATSAVLAMAKTLVSSNYQVKISTDDTTFVNNMWSGIFVVTNYADEEDTYTTQRITVQITGDYEKYVKQKIEKTLAKASSDSPTDISGLFALEEAGFKIELRKYSLERLRSFHDACQSCLDILIQQGIADRESWANKDPDLYRDIYLPYYNKLGYIADEMDIRQAEIDIVAGKFDSDGDIVSQGMQTIIESEKNTIQDALNFENYLGTDLWLEFVAYRREDTYENTNFISDGLDNKELFDKALEFIETAKKDIFKSATLQHSISATLKNLLAMKEFEPIVDYFEVGNWLRVRVDDKVYKLRLLDYEIDFDNLQNITITFSDVTIVSGGLSDVESVLNQAASIATSYGEVARQAKQGKRSSDQLNDWVAKGLALTKMKIVDSADNQDISWDNHGLLCREYLPITDTYDAKQLKLISKGLYLTDDNWLTSRAGIGDFTFWNPKSQQMEETYGVIADTLVGNLILGEEVGIYNTKNSITLDENGLSITTDGINNGANQTAMTIQKKMMDGDGNEYFTQILYVDSNGDIVLNGKIKINSSSDDSISTLDDLSDISRFTEEIQQNIYEELHGENGVYNQIDAKYNEITGYAEQMLNTYKADVGQYLSYDENGLTLGAATSAFKTVIDNQRLAFLDGDNTVAYISNNQLYIPNAVIQRTLSLGKFFFSPREDGGVSLTWQGD